MGFLYTMTAFFASGVCSRVLALGLQNKPLQTELPMSMLWVAGWTTAGYSFHSWREKQEQLYIQRLQYFVDRKERRDKWDQLYFQSSDDHQ